MWRALEPLLPSQEKMTEWIHLVEPVSGTLQVNPAALSFLKTLAGPLQVVAIFGPKGTGKSFLLDQLAGQDEGFPRSPGIWLQCLPHPTKPDDTLVLLDTESLPEQMEQLSECAVVEKKDQLF
uniref:Uncharacterized protein n=1 Tax=Sphaerodactylus townsendi TaxID=933632 RepID=A0ACB8FSP6_9SAUR